MAIPGNFLSATTEMVDPNTSGWAVKTNCTITLGTGGRNGDGTLKLTSLAAGEAQARTASSYPVTPGVTYWTFADASSATVPERIGIRWLNASNAEISITWSLTTTSATATWHRVSVAGVAPASAARAQVVVSAMTPAAAGVINQFENVYFGYPLRLPGNMLSFSAEAPAELDTSAWAVESNCTLSRAGGAFSWGVSYYYSGGELLGLTVTANGNASALCVERPAATPGVEYAAYAYISPPTGSSQCWVELRFYDGAGVQVQVTRSTLAVTTTGIYRQIASAVAPAGAASATIAVGIVGATAAQLMRVETAYIAPVDTFAAASKRSGSVLPMADWDFEQGVGSWTVVSGAATLARSTPWGAQAYSDAYSLTVSSATATTSVIRSDRYPIGAADGLPFRMEFFGRTVAGGWSIALRGVRWYNAANADLGYSSNGPVSAPAPGGWWTLQSDFTAPAGATQAAIEFQLTATAVSSTLQVDRPALWQAEPLLEATPDDGTASVRLVLRELEVGDLITVYRISADGSRTLVRGPDGLLDKTAIEADSMIIEDYEAPLGAPFSYRVEFLNPDGLTGFAYRASGTITLDAGDRNYCWLKHPSMPQLNMHVLVKTGPNWQQPIEQSVMRPRGRQNAVILSDVRGGREGDLVVWTQTDEEREALRLLLAQGDVLLWQCAPGMGETDMYVSVAGTAFPRVSDYGPEPWREWTLPLTEQDMPTSGIAGSATWTVQDVAVENASALSLMDRYVTVLDLALDRRAA